MCKKTVYPMEFIGASGHSFHKACFRCSTCKQKLRADNFATVNNVFYCQPHYDQAFKASGGNYDMK